jgi:hypothetical protein
MGLEGDRVSGRVPMLVGVEMALVAFDLLGRVLGLGGCELRMWL